MDRRIDGTYVYRGLNINLFIKQQRGPKYIQPASQLTWTRDCLRMAEIWFCGANTLLLVLWTETWLEFGLALNSSALIPAPPPPLLLHPEEVEPRLSEARLGVASSPAWACCCWRCRLDMIASTAEAKASTSLVPVEQSGRLGDTGTPASPVTPAWANTVSASSSRQLGFSVAVDRAVKSSWSVETSPRRLVSVSCKQYNNGNIPRWPCRVDQIVVSKT